MLVEFAQPADGVGISEQRDRQIVRNSSLDRTFSGSSVTRDRRSATTVHPGTPAGDQVACITRGKRRLIQFLAGPACRSARRLQFPARRRRPALAAPRSRGLGVRETRSLAAGRTGLAGRGNADWLSLSERTTLLTGPTGRSTSLAGPGNRRILLRPYSTRSAPPPSPGRRKALLPAPGRRSTMLAGPIGRTPALASPTGRTPALAGPTGRIPALVSPAGRTPALAGPGRRRVLLPRPTGHTAMLGRPTGRDAVLTGPAGRRIL
jgi:hypothetical protein